MWTSSSAAAKGSAASARAAQRARRRRGRARGAGACRPRTRCSAWPRGSRGPRSGAGRTRSRCSSIQAWASARKRRRRSRALGRRRGGGGGAMATSLRRWPRLPASNGCGHPSAALTKPDVACHDVSSTASTPADLKALSPEETVAYCDELRDFLIETRLGDGRPPGQQPRRRRADGRAPPGLRLRARPARARHEPSGLPAQGDHGPPRALPDAAPDRRALGLHGPGREPVRHVHLGPRRHRRVAPPHGMALADALRGVGATAACRASSATRRRRSGATFEALNHAGHGERRPARDPQRQQVVDRAHGRRAARST